MNNLKIVEDWVIDDVLDTLRQVQNYCEEVSSTETCLDRCIERSKKLLESIKNTKSIDIVNFNKN